DPEEKSTEVLLEELVIGEDGDLILIRVGGSHFIWKMVRRMVGVLAEIGRGGMDPGQVDTLLAATGPKHEAPARLTAPASGLFLERVFYEGDSRTMPLRAAISVPLAAG
ncbi:MAG: tRNA pseudouridine(38-40) synthase TruA, partial [Vicinamibacterales bacterium]